MDHRIPTSTASGAFRAMNDSAIPLCVCLDGAVSRVRIADEIRMARARQAATAIFEVLKRLLRGRHFTAMATARVDTQTLPLHGELIGWLRAQRNGGRHVLLVADGNLEMARQIAAPLDLFDELAATAAQGGTTAERTRRALVDRFGERGFDYVGTCEADRVVWHSARHAFVVGDLRLQQRIGRQSERLDLPGAPRPSLRHWLRAARVYQWAKNTLIFVPPCLAHVITQPGILARASLAFLAFGLGASSVYLINDLLDLNSDRRHERKRLRPFAAGTLSARDGLAAAAALLACAVLLAVIIGPQFVAVLAGYYVLTWGYSLYLKLVSLVDVMLLAALYTLRLIAGAAATQVALSFWLLAFSVFIFLSLGFVKRYAELDDARRAGRLAGHGRGYEDSDLPLIMSLGTAAGYSAVLVLALYINSADSQSLYQHHKPLWLICPFMLFWISRVWLVTTRGLMHDDPLIFALRDRWSLLLLAALGAIVLVSV
jgi:4-hydroxybenzoate polyprenyltransferase